MFNKLLIFRRKNIPLSVETYVVEVVKATLFIFAHKTHVLCLKFNDFLAMIYKLMLWVVIAQTGYCRESRDTFTV